MENNAITKAKRFLETHFQGLSLEKKEWQKFFPLAFMLFLITFNLVILRTTKEAWVVSQPGSGVEVLSFIKTYCVLPFSLGYMVIYMILSNRMSQQRIFYYSVVPFLCFFLLYGFVLIPYLPLWHMSPEKLRVLQEQYPFLKWILVVAANWGFTLFYIMAELWSAVVLSLLFWQFANNITAPLQAKHFYGLLGLISNFGLVLGGCVVMICSQCPAHMDKAVAWTAGTKFMMILVSLSVAGILVLYFLMTSVMGFRRDFSATVAVKMPDLEEKMSLKEQISYVAQSKHLRCLFIIVVGFFLALTFCEVIVKDRAHKLYQEAHDYCFFMGQLQSSIGVASILLSAISVPLLRFYPWRIGALVTPILMVVTATGLVASICYLDFDVAPATVGTAFFILWFGFIQNTTVRAAKYSFFDPTREMVYIPLNKELRTKGKACVDLLGGRLGKGGGAWFQSVIFIFTGLSFKELTPIFFLILCGLVIVWIMSIQRLSKIQAVSLANNQEVTQEK